MPLVDRGGRWHATIPRKGNRWLPMPDFALSQLNDLIDRQPQAEKIRKDFKDLGLRSRNVGRMLARGEVAAAQAKVQTLMDKFPWATFADQVESNHDEELGQVDKLEEALQAFLDVDPDDFLDRVKEPTKAAPVAAPEPEPVNKFGPGPSQRAYEQLWVILHDEEDPLSADDPRQQAWNSAENNMDDSEREMGDSFPEEGTEDWFSLFMSSYEAALEGHQEEQRQAEQARQQDEENRRLEAAPTPEPAEVDPKKEQALLDGSDYLKKQFQKGYRSLGGVIAQGEWGRVEIGNVAGGKKVVRKETPDERMADREEFASQVANAVGIEMFTARVGPKDIITSYADGDLGMKWIRDRLAEIPVDKSLSDSELREVQREQRKVVDKLAAESLEGAKEVGLLDYLTGNWDRNWKNWITKDGKVFPIDHGFAEFDEGRTEKALLIGQFSEFARRSLGVKTAVDEDYNVEIESWDPGSQWTLAELDRIKSRLEAMKDRFKARPSWYDFAEARLDKIREMVKESEQEKAAEPAVEPAFEFEPAPKREVRPAGWLKEQFDLGYRRDNSAFMPQGNKAVVELGYLADGTKVVRKKAKTVRENDREVVAARIAQVIGLDFHAERVDPHQVIMGFVEGDVGSTWGRKQMALIPLDPALDKYDGIYKRSKQIAAAAAELPNAKEIGLLDYLIANEDRHDGNWILGVNGKMYPIDHGLAQFSDQEVPSEKAVFYGHGFTQTSLGIEFDEYGYSGSWDPSKNWTHQELEDVKTGLINLRADRAVRTRKRWIDEALKRIDIVIAKMPPKQEPAPEVAAVRSDHQLKSVFEAGYTPTEDKIFQGNTATVEIGVVADGTQVVRKLVKQEKEADTEYLAGLVANTIGVGPVTVKTGPNEIIMEYVADAKTGNGWINANLDKFKPNHNLGWEKAERDRYDRMFQHMVEMPGGKEIGLLDFLIDNGDRHAGNWMIKDDTVIPIDHGNARWHPMRYIDEKTGKEVEQFNGSPFAVHWLGAKLTRYGDLRRMDPQKHWTNQELADIRSKLQDLKEDFTDHPDWHDAIMAKIDRVLEKVKK